MIAGATYTLPVTIPYDLEKVNRVLVTLKNESTGIMRIKHYPHDSQTWLMPGGRLGVRLSQKDTLDLVGKVKIEAQINLASGAVAKTETKRVFVSPTLHTEMVEGATDNGEVYLEDVVLEIGAPITENANGGGNFSVDDTLTVEGAAADAKAVGDRFAALKNEIPVHTWESLPDKPFYEETEVVNEPLNITWDGNTEGLVRVDWGEDKYYKVSNTVLTDEQIKTVTVVVSDGYTENLADSWDWMVENGRVTEDIIMSMVVFVRTAGATFIGITFPEEGIYFVAFTDGVFISSITTTEPIEHTKTTVHTLDKKFLPKAETSDIVFTGVPNEDGWYDYTCNVDYETARKALTEGATARMILVSGKEIKHLTLQLVRYNDWGVTLNFFDIMDTSNEYGIIRYNEDGSIGGGVE